MTLNVVGFILIVLGGSGALFFSAKADEKGIFSQKRRREVGIALVCVIILLIGISMFTKA